MVVFLHLTNNTGVSVHCVGFLVNKYCQVICLTINVLKMTQMIRTILPFSHHHNPNHHHSLSHHYHNHHHCLNHHHHHHHHHHRDLLLPLLNEGVEEEPEAFLPVLLGVRVPQLLLLGVQLHSHLVTRIVMMMTLGVMVMVPTMMIRVIAISHHNYSCSQSNSIPTF